MQHEAKARAKKVEYLKREHIVLTKELKEKVEKAVLHWLKWAKTTYNVDIPMPEMHYDLKRLVTGMYSHSSQNPGAKDHGKVPSFNKLRWHPIFLVENETDYIEETVPHEIAHMIVSWVWKGIPKEKGAKKVVAHGPEWREVMVKMGKGPRPNLPWEKIINAFYNPASLDIPPRKKLGPRKPGGKNVGELMVKIKKLKPEELMALLTRLGLEGVAKNPPEVQEEVDTLEEYLWNSKEYRHHRAPSFSSAGWALNVIKMLEAK